MNGQQSQKVSMNGQKSQKVSMNGLPYNNNKNKYKNKHNIGWCLTFVGVYI